MAQNRDVRLCARYISAGKYRPYRAFANTFRICRLNHIQSKLTPAVSNLPAKLSAFEKNIFNKTTTQVGLHLHLTTMFELFATITSGVHALADLHKYDL